jgi:hypothetical protein
MSFSTLLLGLSAVCVVAGIRFIASAFTNEEIKEE